mmetsp:Transcript_25862/g.49147  ORF Transcript_25862/g.49147 Transcript_25862/m.49147 type:complete len:378 (-) Transcript_25862:905-2038(-)
MISSVREENVVAGPALVLSLELFHGIQQLDALLGGKLLDPAYQHVVQVQQGRTVNVLLLQRSSCFVVETQAHGQPQHHLVRAPIQHVRRLGGVQAHFFETALGALLQFLDFVKEADEVEGLGAARGAQNLRNLELVVGGGPGEGMHNLAAVRAHFIAERGPAGGQHLLQHAHCLGGESEKVSLGQGHQDAHHRQHSAHLDPVVVQVCQVDELVKPHLEHLPGVGLLGFSFFPQHAVVQHLAHPSPRHHALCVLQSVQQSAHAQLLRLAQLGLHLAHGTDDHFPLKPQVRARLTHPRLQQRQHRLPIGVGLFVIRSLFQEVVEDLGALVLHRQHQRSHAVGVHHIDVEHVGVLAVVQQLLDEGGLARADRPMQNTRAA